MVLIRDNGYTLHHRHSGPVDSNQLIASDFTSGETGGFFITGGSAPKDAGELGTYKRGHGKIVPCHPPFEWRKDEE